MRPGGTLTGVVDVIAVTSGTWVEGSSSKAQEEAWNDGGICGRGDYTEGV